MTLSRPLKITGWILLAITVAVILFLMLFDWNMLRPYINRKVSETTGREFAIRGGLIDLFPTGEQYALPEAVGALRDARRSANANQLISLSAADPLNVVGILTPGARLPGLSASSVRCWSVSSPTPCSANPSSIPANYMQMIWMYGYAKLKTDR